MNRGDRRITFRRLTRRIACGFGLALIVGCDLPVVSAGSDRLSAPSALKPLEAYAERPLPTHDPRWSVVGDVGFDAAALSADRRVWFDRLHVGLTTSAPEMVRLAESDNSYEMGRWLFQFSHAALTGLRMTGDLRFLDVIDPVAEAMRAQLDDSWCGGVARSLEVNLRYGTVGEPDGYRNFRWRGSRNHRNHCRDTGDLDETLVHGHLAMIMDAYHANRDLPSPGGVDYGERADFWFAYLRDDFEAKWRERSGTEWPDMDFIDAKFCHTYAQMTLYYYFVGRRLQSEDSAAAGPYLNQAQRMTDGLFEVNHVDGQQPGGFIDADTPLGPAVVYPVGSPARGSDSSIHFEACPTTYARYMMTSLLVLYMDGFDRWDDDIMTRLANGFAHFVIDTDDLVDVALPFAAGVTGERDVAGLRRTEYRNRNSVADLNLSPFAALAVWDASGRIEATFETVYELSEADPARPEQPFVAAGMLFSRSFADARK